MGTEKLKVLVVDDNKENLESVRVAILRAFPGSAVFTTDGGQQGLEVARRAEPDVILLDLVMPGMDGLEVCRRIRADEKLKHIPVVFVAADLSDKETRVQAVQAGADGFLGKPFELEELAAQVRAMAKIKASRGPYGPDAERLAWLDKAMSRPADNTRLITICSSCKKVRNEKDTWENVEVMVKKLANVSFSHGYCPECAKRLHPDLFKDV